MYITNKKGTSERSNESGPYARTSACSFFFFSKLIYKIRQIRYRRSEWLWVVRGSVVPILTTLSFPAYP
jgi:hypothetical protein